MPDGTPMNRAGNAINHPETIGPDPHTPGSPLPRALFCNSVGYLPDGTAMNAAGNAMNHPETMQPDMHTPGSPLPKSHYYADVGYLVDGTDMATAGNLSVQVRSFKGLDIIVVSVHKTFFVRLCYPPETSCNIMLYQYYAVYNISLCPFVILGRILQNPYTHSLVTSRSSKLQCDVQHQV